MKVLLISANRHREPEPVFPLGCACLLAALRRAGHETAFVDLLAPGPLDGEALKKKSPRLTPAPSR